MGKFFYTFLISTILFLGVFSFVFSVEKTEMYFFWGDGCPYCANAKPFIEELKKEYPQLEIKSYEVYNNRSNAELFGSMAIAYNAYDMGGVPAFFIGDNAFSGYHESMNDNFRELVESCINFKCVSPMSILSEFQGVTGNDSVSDVDKNYYGNSSSTFIFLVIFGFFIWLIYFTFARNSEKE